MKKLFITLSTLALFIACGNSKSEGTTTAENTQTASTDASTTPMVLNWQYYSKLASEMKLDGVAMTNLSVEPDAENHGLYADWEITDFATAGCNKIRLSLNSTKSGAGESEFTDYSLEKFTQIKQKEWKGRDISNFMEYPKSNGKCYYFYIKDWMYLGSKLNSIVYQYVDEKAEVVIDGYIDINDTKANFTKAEETTKKVFDYLAK